MSSVAAAVEAATATRAVWRRALEVFKPRIALEIMLCAVAGVTMTAADGLDWWRLLVLAAGVFAAAGAAGALNHLAEKDIDGRMLRTRSRPFVDGTFTAGRGWYALIAGIELAAVAAVALATNWQAAAWVFLGAFTYGVVYTLWLKRRTWLNIVIGGLAGSFAVLAGAAAIEPVPTKAAWIFASVLFLWTPPHFWSLSMYYRQDYAAAGVPMLPVVHGDRIAARAIFAHTVTLTVLSLLPLAWGLGWFYGACAAGGGACFTWRSLLLLRDPTPRHAIRTFLASLLQLSLLLIGAIVEGALSGTLLRF